jgi:hypothetical protein
MIVTIALALLFSWSQSPDKGAQPLVSATDPAYLGCTIWTGKEWTNPSARSAKTPLIQSARGFRAYAEVKVVVKDDSCENTTTLYVASDAEQKFRIAYTKLPSASDGNGIHVIGWSPSGGKLLAEVNLWKYETDLGYGHVALIYDASTDSAKEIPALNEAFTRHFGPNCEFELAIKGWKTNEQILVRISRTPESEEYEQHFCVKEPRIFVYDLQKETLQVDRPRPQILN